MKQYRTIAHANKLLYVTLVLAMIISIFAFPSTANAEQINASTILQPYEDELAAFNQAYGTDYQFKLMDEAEDEEEQLAAFFSQMTMSEFRTYLMAAYENDITNQSAGNASEPSNSTNYTTGIMPRTVYSTYQRCFYGDGGNGFYVEASVYSSPVSTEHHRYTDIIGCGYLDTDVYPKYVPYKIEYIISSDAYYVDFTYYCYRYVSENLVNTTKYTLPVCYEAGKGGTFIEVSA